MREATADHRRTAEDAAAHERAHAVRADGHLCPSREGYFDAEQEVKLHALRRQLKAILEE